MTFTQIILLDTWNLRMHTYNPCTSYRIWQIMVKYNLEPSSLTAPFLPTQTTKHIAHVQPSGNLHIFPASVWSKRCLRVRRVRRQRCLWPNLKQCSLISTSSRQRHIKCQNIRPTSCSSDAPLATTWFSMYLHVRTSSPGQSLFACTPMHYPCSLLS